MELATSIKLVKTNLRQALALGVLASALGACAHATTEELVDARAAYRDAKSSPARTRRPNELEAARVALERAELAHDKNPGSNQEAQLAANAERKAKIAMAHGEAAQADREADVAEREAAQARARANAAERGRAEDQVRSERAEETRSAARDDDRRDKERSSGGEKTRERRSAAALQNLAAVANVREEPRGVVITLSGSLLFPSGQEELSPIARQNLDQVAHALAEQPANTHFQVAGYTDDTGAPAKNERLSTQRAQAVATHLVQSGIERDRVHVDGYGESRPIAGNDTPEGRAANRRVEIVIEPSAGATHASR